MCQKGGCLFVKINNAYIEITNICNLNCRSCYNRSGVPHTKKELSLAKIITLTDRLINEYGCERISLSGGEPTLHSEFSEILEYLLKYDVQIGVVTNGTSENESFINTINENEKISIQVSLDGSCEEINAKTRGTGSFIKTKAFLSKLNKAKKPFVKMVISQNNIEDVRSFYELAVSLDCIPEFDFINIMGNAGEVWQALSLSAKQKLGVLRLISNLNKEYGISAHLPYCTSSCPLAVPESAHSVLIKSDGSAYPCQMLYSDKYVLGNLLTDDMEVFETSFRKIADIAQKRIKTDYGCEKCLAKIVCKKGCMAFAEMNTGDPLANDGECDFRKLQIIGFHALGQGVPK